MKKLLFILSLIILCSVTAFTQEYNLYEGTCVEGDCINGQGTFTWPNGTKYVGRWKDGKYDQGTMTYPRGEQYVGEWKDDLYNGQGTFTWTNGKKYVGQWKDGKYNGQGTMTYPRGEQYVGEWKDDFYNGQGTMTYADGSKYDGQWKDGFYNGQGTMTYADGSKHVGQWDNDYPNGQGTFTWTNGKKYVGQFKDGVKDGQGTCYDKKGRKFECSIRVKKMILEEPATKYAEGGIQVKKMILEEPETKYSEGDLPLGVDVYYYGYDTLTKLKAKNPDITFSEKTPDDVVNGSTLFKTVVRQRTEASFIFNSEGHLYFVQINKKLAFREDYDALVKKYTEIYGEPKESNPYTVNLNQKVASAACNWENGKRSTWIILVVPLTPYKVPWIQLLDLWDSNK